MRTHVAAAAVAAVLLAGCGENAFSRGAGRHCDDADRRGHSVPSLHDLLTTGRWAEVSEVADRGAAPGGQREARLTVTSTIRGEWSPTTDVRVDGGAPDEARAERSGRSRVLAVGSDAAVGLVSLRPNGEAHFLGGCADETFRPALTQFARERRDAGDPRSERDLLLAIVQEPDGDVARALAARTGASPAPVPTPWESLSPDERVVDASAPAAVLAALESRTLVFRLPAAWQGAEVQLCPRTRVGWGVCTVPQAAKGVIELAAYVQPEAPLEIWVTDRHRGFRGQRTLALRIPAASLSVERVEIAGGEGVATAPDAHRAAAAGTALRLP